MDRDREDRYDKVIQAGLIGLIIFTPLPKASVDAFYFSILELVVFGLMVVWSVKIIRGGGRAGKNEEGGGVYWRKTFLLLPVILFIFLVIFQLLPFPPKVIKSLSPATNRFYEELLPVYGAGEAANNRPGTALFDQDDRADTALLPLKAPGNRRTLSFYAHNTREYLFKILIYAAVFFLVLQTVRTRRQAKRIIYAILFTGFALAVLSIIQRYSSNGKALWLWEPILPDTRPYGPFVNRNHFAGYINLVIPLGIGIAMYEMERRLRNVTGRSVKKKLILLGEKGPRVFIFIFASVTMATALLLSLSRGGIFSFVGAMLFMALMLASRKAIRKKAVLILITISSIMVAIAWFGWDPIIYRLESIKYLSAYPFAQPRMLFWSDTISMFKDYPVYGTGMGTFINTFPIYKSFNQFYWIWYAENDFLQTLSEGGIIGGGLAAWFLVMFFSKTVKRWKERNDRFVVYIVLGCLTGIVGFLLASVTNFNFYIPANPFLFTMVAGVGFALVNTRSGSGRKGEKSRAIKSVPIGKIKRYLLFPLLLAVLALLSIQVAYILAADVYYSRAKKVLQSQAPYKGLELAYSNKAISLNPINSEYRDWKARQNLKRMERSFTPYMKKWWAKRAVNGFEQAIILEPTNSYYWMHLGWTAGFQTGEYRLALNAFENSVKLNPTNYALHKQYARWAFAMVRDMRDKSDVPGKSEAEAASGVEPEAVELKPDGKMLLDIGVREFRAAAALNSSLIEEALWEYSEFTLDPDELIKIVPRGDDTDLIEEIISRRIKEQKVEP